MAAIPFISPTDFSHACEQLEAASAKVNSKGFRARLCGQGVDQFLEITRTLSTSLTPQSTCGSRDEPALQVDELDEETDSNVVYPTASASDNKVVEYDIVLSQTYRVPVLYVVLPQEAGNGVRGIEFIHRNLVAKSLAPQLVDMGILGGVTMTNHPITDMPCYFIHPCRTADALREIIGTRQVFKLEYLQIWIGLIGACVGLHLPKELAVKQN